MAAAAGADWKALAWTGEKPERGIPAAARSARHRLLANAAREAGASVVLLGHTLDDRRESALIRKETPTLGRMREWAPSPVWPDGRDVFVMRPLLDVSRADLRAWLRERGLEWIEDPANADPRFARARARMELQDADEPDDIGDVTLPLMDVEETPSAGFRVRRADLMAMEPDQRVWLLARLILCASGRERPPRCKSVRRLCERLAGRGEWKATLAATMIEARDSWVEVAREQGRTGLPSLQVPMNVGDVWDGRYAVMSGKNDKLCALGAGGELPHPPLHEDVEPLGKRWLRSLTLDRLFSNGVKRECVHLREIFVARQEA